MFYFLLYSILYIIGIIFEFKFFFSNIIVKFFFQCKIDKIVFKVIISKIGIKIGKIEEINVKIIYSVSVFIDSVKIIDCIKKDYERKW